MTMTLSRSRGRESPADSFGKTANTSLSIEPTASAPSGEKRENRDFSPLRFLIRFPELFTGGRGEPQQAPFAPVECLLRLGLHSYDGPCRQSGDYPERQIYQQQVEREH